MQFSATLYDSTNSVVTGYIEWSATNGTIDGAGLFTPWSTGNVSITAVSEGISDSINLTVDPGWPSALFVYGNLSEVGLDSSVQLTASLVDSRGNEVLGQILTWSPSQGNVSEDGVWTPSQIGNASIEVHWGELSATIEITVVPGQAATITLPSGLSVRAGESISFSPAIHDSYGNLLQISSVGSLQWNAEAGTITAGMSST